MAANQGNPTDEYLDVSTNMRQYGNMRFAQLTLFIAVLAGLLAILFRFDPPLESTIRYILKFGGLIITIVFWVMEERSTSYWDHYRSRAVELEKQLGYKQYSKRPERGLFSATNAVRFFFFFIVFLWLALIIKHPIF